MSCTLRDNIAQIIHDEAEWRPGDNPDTVSKNAADSIINHMGWDGDTMTEQHNHLHITIKTTDGKNIHGFVEAITEQELDRRLGNATRSALLRLIHNDGTTDRWVNLDHAREVQITDPDKGNLTRSF